MRWDGVTAFRESILRHSILFPPAISHVMLKTVTFSEDLYIYYLLIKELFVIMRPSVSVFAVIIVSKLKE